MLHSSVFRHSYHKVISAAVIVISSLDFIVEYSLPAERVGKAREL
jgi:hypothetical protein